MASLESWNDIPWGAQQTLAGLCACPGRVSTLPLNPVCLVRERGVCGGRWLSCPAVFTVYIVVVFS